MKISLLPRTHNTKRKANPTTKAINNLKAKYISKKERKWKQKDTKNNPKNCKNGRINLDFIFS